MMPLTVSAARTYASPVAGKQPATGLGGPDYVAAKAVSSCEHDGFFASGVSSMGGRAGEAERPAGCRVPVRQLPFRSPTLLAEVVGGSKPHVEHHIMTGISLGASAPTVFNFRSTEVRTLVLDGEVWFVASDVAKALSYRNADDMTRMLDEDERGTHIVRTVTTNQHGTTSEQDNTVIVINESGLYHAVLKSRKPEAKPFRKWVTSEVLPAIRKTGQYAATAPQALAATPALDAQTIARINRHAWALAQSTFERYRRELTRDIEKGFHRKDVEEWQPPEYRAQFIERLAGSAAVLDHFAEAIRRDTKSLCDMGGVDYDAVTKAYRSLS
jgi:prophage antirepressor-like protein